ncbi:MAD2L1-binding protein-like [Watersipora subatra]|uniref:MAD2L1-binding protein-like n=1 Tax=Watersipora subatra TaxID=2589382 RepID=UPI00355B289F
MEKTEREKQKEHKCTIKISGLISRKSCSSVTTELLKYVLLQRDQVPDTFNSLLSSKEQVSKDIKADAKINPYLKAPNVKSFDVKDSLEAQSLENGGSMVVHAKGLLRDDYQSAGQGQIRPLRRPASLAVRKLDRAVDIMTQICSKLRLAFAESALPIKKVAFILGSSVVVPKDTFVLTFPANHVEGEEVPLDMIKRDFFRELVTTDFLGSFSGLASYRPQKLFVLLLTSRDAGITWFTPVPRFSLPSRGRSYSIDLLNTPANANICVSKNYSILLDISGVSPMDVSFEQSETGSPTPPNAKRLRLERSFEEEADTEELIWYQAPVALHGCR